jgi:hypothetical protein
MKQALTGIARRWRSWLHAGDAHERTLALNGRIMAEHVRARSHIDVLSDVEFRVFSQFGDDGIIQWLVARLPHIPQRFVEFGVEDYSESNTRFLLINDNWSGLVMDGSPRNISRLKRRPWFWRHDLTANAVFVTRENVNALIAAWAGAEEIGLLHIDVDGNDYWLWEAIDCVRPPIVIMEYNALFGAQRAITIPYAADFHRFSAHYSGQFFGASLGALTHLAESRGYRLVGCNSAGNNAYFVRNDVAGPNIPARSVADAFVEPKFRDSRDRNGQLDFQSFAQRQALLKGMSVWNVTTHQAESF